MKKFKYLLKPVNEQMSATELTECFNEVAHYLIQNFVIEYKGKEYQLLEIEFYYHSPVYVDKRKSEEQTITYQRSSGSCTIAVSILRLTTRNRSMVVAFWYAKFATAIPVMSLMVAESAVGRYFRNDWMLSLVAPNPRLVKTETPFEITLTIDFRKRLKSKEQKPIKWRFKVNGK